MHKIAKAILVLCIWMSSAYGKVVVFWQEGFPTLESQPVPLETLQKALDGWQPGFANLDELNKQEALRSADLLVLPYGSAVPADAWAAVVKYLQAGGNLLVLGGRALAVPVRKQGGKFVASRPEAAYSRQIGVWHTYEAPLRPGLRFAWKDATLSGGDVQAKRVFVLEGANRGLGFLVIARASAWRHRRSPQISWALRSKRAPSYASARRRRQSPLSWAWRAKRAPS